MIVALPPALVCFVAQPPKPLDLENKQISLQFKNTPTQQAFEALFKSVGITNYRIEGGVTGTVTLMIDVKGFEEALRLLLKNNTSPTPLTIVKEEGTWIIKPRALQNISGGGGQGRGPSLPEGPLYPIAVRYRTLEELQLVFGGIINLVDMDILSEKPAPAGKPVVNSGGLMGRGLGGGGFTSARQRRQLSFVGSGALRPPGVDAIYALGNGTILVQGEKKEVEEMARRLQAIDVPTPSLEYRVEVVSVSDGKRARNVLLSAIDSGKCGREITAQSKFSGTPAQTSKLEVTLVATPLGDNAYEVESRWEASLPLPGAQKGQLIRLEKNFSNTRRVRAGETVMFGGVILKEEQGATKGGQEVLFFLTIKPIP